MPAFVEILGHDDQPVPDGERGEVTLTGGSNFCLPLMRYRTSDHASLKHGDGVPVLQRLHGRAPVRLRTAAGAWIDNIDVTHALQPWPLAQHALQPWPLAQYALHPWPLARYALHQAADGALTRRLAPASAAHVPAVRAALAALFGDLPLSVETLLAEEKMLQYTSALELSAT